MKIIKWVSIDDVLSKIPALEYFLSLERNNHPKELEGKLSYIREEERYAPPGIVFPRNDYRNNAKITYVSSPNNKKAIKNYYQYKIERLNELKEKSENEPIICNDLNDLFKFIFGGFRVITENKTYNTWNYKCQFFVTISLVENINYSLSEYQLKIYEFYDKERRNWERLKRLYSSDNAKGEMIKREKIPEDVRIAVWRRDGGKCARCGSREKLEYDHIIPISKGGSNTERNIELLCEKCNREKSAKIQ